MKKLDIKEIKKLGIIAGGDSLPKHVLDAAQEKGIECVLITLPGHATAELYEGTKHQSFQAHAVSKILKHLKQNGVSHIVFAGKVKRSGISKLLLDVKGARLFANIVRNGLNDNSILSTIVSFFENEGFIVVPAECIASDIIATKGHITKCHPDKESLNDIVKGVKILKGIAEFDVGQALVIQEGLVLGVEAAEGTDELIRRCGSIRHKEEHGAILIKVSKPNQDKRVDLPCIGVQTVLELNQNGLIGVAIEAGSAIILNKEETVRKADEMGIFIYGV